MLLCDVKKVLNADLLTSDSDALNTTEILTACGCDLMSDVLAFVKEQTMLMTGLINSQVIRTAEMMDIKAIVFVRGKKPTEDIAELAREYKMVVMTTDYTLYPSCGKLYCAGLVPNEERVD